VQQQTAPLQIVLNPGVGVPYLHARKRLGVGLLGVESRRHEAALVVHRCIGWQTVFGSQIEILRTVARGGVDAARSLVQCDVLSQDEDRLAATPLGIGPSRGPKLY